MDGGNIDATTQPPPIPKSADDHDKDEKLDNDRSETDGNSYDNGEQLDYDIEFVKGKKGALDLQEK